MRTYCEDCGSAKYDGFCTWCDEEHFIAEQYMMDGEGVPPTIAELAEEQKIRKEARERPKIEEYLP